ncbi:MAG: amino acid ABC transporter permease [Lachnospiraceae bacterium]
MGEYFSFERVTEYFPKIITSLPTTVLIVFFAILFGTVLGITLAYIRIHKIPVLYQIASVYISFVRGTPQIIQLFLVYYGFPKLVDALFGINVNRWDAIYFVILAYSINESAYLSETFRGGLQSIPNGQYEAGYACGLTKFQTFKRVVLPQTFRIVLPSVEVGIITLFQNTSMAASVGVRDMMGRAMLLGAFTKHYTENLFCTALIFIVVSIVLEFLFHKLNQKIQFNGKEKKRL